MKPNRRKVTLISLTLGLLLSLPFLKGSTDEQLNHLKLETVTPRKSDPMRGVEYYEYFLVYRNYANFKGAVYNNIRTKPIPLADWEASDPAGLAKEFGAFKVLKNGPRFWTLDAIAGYQIGERRNFNGYDLDLMGVLDLSLKDLFNRENYKERRIERYTDFYFNQGSKIFLLVSDTGAEYFMQSASREVDPEMDLKRLETLGQDLDLPQGWTYKVVTLEADLVIETRGDGYVIQDDFLNTYQRKPA